MKKVTNKIIEAEQAGLCPMINAMDVIGGKWKLLVIYYLRDGALRFSDFRRVLPSITTKMLTQQLRELEQDKVVTRTVYPVIPPKVEYALTERGKRLQPIIEQLKLWGKGVVKTA